MRDINPFDHLTFGFVFIGEERPKLRRNRPKFVHYAYVLIKVAL